MAAPKKSGDHNRSEMPEIPELLAQEMDTDDLSRLVRDANDAGESYRQMADRATKAGHTLSKDYLQKLATRTVTKAPLPMQLEALAVALRKPAALVRLAAARQFLQYEARELEGFNDEVRLVVAQLSEMSQDDVRRWRHMIEADERARSESDESAP